MPGGRRNLSRTNKPPQPFFSSEDIHKAKLGLQGEGISSKVVSPRHIPVPSLPQDSNVLFEVVMFTFTAMATFLQFLHLYRSVWWLPQSYTRYSMNFYLIDPYLVGFIGTILGRRLVYSLICHVLMMWTPPSVWTVLQQLVRLLLLGLVLTCLVWCAYNIMQNHPIVNIFYLCYPLSVYFILFGLSITPFFDVMALPSFLSEESKAAARILGKPLHSCSMSPQTIREEVDYLKTDFNNRMKQILFSSVLNAYYAGFVPCCFAQNFLYYDLYWATQHLTFVWFGCFTMYLVHCYPVKYCDTLHRAALHLGKWARVEGRSCHLPSHLCLLFPILEHVLGPNLMYTHTQPSWICVHQISTNPRWLRMGVHQISTRNMFQNWKKWAESTLWHQGALVKHCKELYKAEGISNAAEPGNPSHTRFYTIFNNPSVPLCSLVGFQLSLVVLQVVILIRASEWYQIVSLALLLFANYYTLFKLSRDYLVCWKVYKAEAMIQDKISGG